MLLVVADDRDLPQFVEQLAVCVCDRPRIAFEVEQSAFVDRAGIDAVQKTTARCMSDTVRDQSSLHILMRKLGTASDHQDTARQRAHLQHSTFFHEDLQMLPEAMKTTHSAVCGSKPTV